MRLPAPSMSALLSAVNVSAAEAAEGSAMTPAAEALLAAAVAETYAENAVQLNASALTASRRSHRIYEFDRAYHALRAARAARREAVERYENEVRG